MYPIFKCVALDLIVTSQWSTFQCYLTDKAFQRTSTVLNGEFSTVFREGVGAGRIVSLVQETSDRVTVGRRNPKIGWTSIKNNSERLRRSTDFDFTIVLFLLFHPLILLLWLQIQTLKIEIAVPERSYSWIKEHHGWHYRPCWLGKCPWIVHCVEKTWSTFESNIHQYESIFEVSR